MSDNSTGNKVTTTIGKEGFLSAMKEVLNSRFLIISFFKRDFKVRYAQTYLGTLWAFLQPLTLAIPVLVIFKRLNLQSDYNYTVLIMCALPLWLYFSNTVNQVANSLQQNQNLIKKVWFPRLALPFSKALLNLIDLIAGLAIAFGIIIYTDTPFTSTYLLIPLVIIQLIAVSTGLGLFIAAFSIRYRDVLQTLGLILQILMLASPVLYTAGFVKNWDIESIYYLNPIVAILELMRACVLNSYELNLNGIALSLIMGWAISFSGLYFFIKKSRNAGELL